MNAETLSTLRTRASLLLRVRNWDDSVSWEEFYRLYRRLVFGFARRSGLSHPDAQEVTQDVFKRLAQTIHEFDANREGGSFRGWLLNLTRWRIADKLRSRSKAEQQGPGRLTDGDRTRTIERVPQRENAEELWNREWQLHLLQGALDRVARRVKPEHFQAFDLYMRQNWTTRQVSAKLGISPARVYLIGHRLTRQLKDEIAKLHAQAD